MVIQAYVAATYTKWTCLIKMPEALYYCTSVSHPSTIAQPKTWFISPLTVAQQDFLHPGAWAPQAALLQGQVVCA
jgi:hypothetical protein